MTTTFNMQDQNISMVKGDTLSFGLEIEGLTDLDSAYFTCKKDLDESPVFQKSIGNGITKLTDGQYIVRIAPEDTNDIEAGKYFYDLQISANSDVFTILRGVLDILQDVTN